MKNNDINLPLSSLIWGVFWLNILYAIITAPNDYSLNFSHATSIFKKIDQGFNQISNAVEEAVLKDYANPRKTNNYKFKPRKNNY